MATKPILLALLLAGCMAATSVPALAGGGGGKSSEAGEAPSSSGARDSGASTGAAETGPAATSDQPCEEGERWDQAAGACVEASAQQ